MLNIFKQKMENVLTVKQNVKPNSKFRIGKSSKHFPSSIREWKQSIFVFNKNSINLIPSTNKLAMEFIKSYFDAYNKNLDVKMRSKALKFRLRRLSTNKFYISSGGFKHTNKKLDINLYTFNRQKNNYLLTLKNWYLKKLLTSNLVSKKTNNSALFASKTMSNKNSVLNGYVNKTKNLNNKFIKRLNIIKHKGIQAALKITNDKYSLVKGLNTSLLSKTNLNSVQIQNNFIKNSSDKTNLNYDMSFVYKINNFSNYTKNFYFFLIRKSLKKIRMYFFYKQLLYINKSKLNYTYLHYLKKYLEKIYKKNVEFNIINMKKFYLNSDIATQAISSKLTKNRRKILKYINMFKNKIKVTKKKLYLGADSENNFIYTPNLVKNLTVCSFNTQNSVAKGENTNNPSLRKLQIDSTYETSSNYILQKHIINNLKYKDITGFKLEAKGRLTKRFAAARSVYKHKSNGGLYEIDSSFRNLSSVLLKGNLKSNTQYTKLKSKTRIGSFGLKGWVSGN